MEYSQVGKALVFGTSRQRFESFYSKIKQLPQNKDRLVTQGLEYTPDKCKDGGSSPLKPKRIYLEPSKIY